MLPRGALRVRRGGHLGAGGAETPTETPVGTEVVLGPGDALLSRGEQTFVAANPGSMPVELLPAVLTNRYGSTNTIPPGWVEHDLDGVDVDLSVSDQPTTLRLRRATLAPKTSLPPLPRTVDRVAVTLSVEFSLGRQTDGGLRNLNEEPVTGYVLSLEAAGAGSPVGATAAATLAPSRTPRPLSTKGRDHPRPFVLPGPRRVRCGSARLRERPGAAPSGWMRRPASGIVVAIPPVRA